MNKKIEKFLQQSNYIEREYSEIAFKDAKKAWEFAFENKDKINLDYILEIHRLLAKRLRPDIAGKWRNCNVWISGHRKRFVSESLFRTEMGDVLANINTKKVIDNKEEFAKHCHILFESIHCFEDFNGRTGRILYNIHRINLGLPIKVIHEGEEQIQYYKWFR